MTTLNKLVSHNLLAGIVLASIIQPSLADTPLGKEMSLNSPAETANVEENLPTLAQAEEPDSPSEESEEDSEDTLRIVITATRTEENVNDVPRTVRVIDREDLQQQLELSNNLQDVLGKLVPGFSPPPLQTDSRGFTLRGRDALVLIDGIPQNANAGVNFFNSIAPDSIERIEVVPGASALYGDGATGGVVNIITRAPVEDGIVYEADFGVTAALTNLDDDGAFSYRGGLGVAAAGDGGDARLSISYEEDNARFDADGDRIIPGIGESDSVGVLAKIGYDVDNNQRVGITYSFFKDTRDTDFGSDPAVGVEPGTQVARAIFVGESFDFEETPQSINHNLNLTYRHADVFGSQLDAQFYLRDIDEAQAVADLRPFGFPEFFPQIFQNLIETSEVGARLQVDTPLGDFGNLLWGVDYSEEENEIVAAIIDPVAFDANQEANIFDELSLFPPYEIQNLGLFAQARWDISDQFQVSGGIRYDNIDYSLDDFQLAFAFPREREGGSGGEEDVSYNFGLLYRPVPEVDLFANFSQGFSIPNIGFAVSDPNPDFTIDSILLEPQSVDNFEVGARAEFDSIQATISGFYNESSLGASINFDPETGFTEASRAPQRHYGVETTLDWQPSNTWRLGGTFTWAEGENDADDDGNFVALGSLNVPPYKLGLYVENQTTPRWSNRLQLQLVGDRDRAFDDGVDLFEVDSYVTLDLISSLRLGPGRLTLGIENLLNNDYLSAAAQERIEPFDDRRFASPGTTMSVRYSVEF
ncbi:MAG: TonB-dependent receptor [Cyanobacteria bacterium P01_D01_bin.56]